MSLKFAVVGYPVKHSKSPKIFDLLKKHYGLDYSYEALEIPPEEFEKSFELLKKYDGLNITSPYKEKILAFCTKKSPQVEILKAANVFKKINGDKFQAFNTDVYGFKQTLEPFGLTDESVLVFGSSGGARAAILGLQEMGVKDIYVKARNYTGYRNFHVPVKEYTNQKPQVIVQATTLGMNDSSFDEKFFDVDYSQCKIAFDLIYSPKVTSFMKIAQKNNIPHILNGENMLAYQALKTFDFWFGHQVEKTSNILNKLKEIL